MSDFLDVDDFTVGVALILKELNEPVLRVFHITSLNYASAKEVVSPMDDLESEHFVISVVGDFTIANAKRNARKFRRGTGKIRQFVNDEQIRYSQTALWSRERGR